MKNIMILDGIYHVLFEDAAMTTGFFDRFIGLMGRKEIEEDQALCIKPCNSIHMLFMQFSIDVIFLDSSNKVIKLIENLKPWRLCEIVKNAETVIEMASGSIKNKDIRLNDTIFLLDK